MHKGSKKNRGYIGMIVVLKNYRGLGIGNKPFILSLPLLHTGKKLAKLFIEKVKNSGGEEIVLETEVVNQAP